MGGQFHEFDNCPVDKIVMAYSEGELSELFELDGLKMKNQQVAEKILGQTIDGLTEVMAFIEEKHGRIARDVKLGVVDLKYNHVDAYAQLLDAKQFLKSQSSPDTATPGGDTVMEGGAEDQHQIKDFNPHKYDDDTYDYKGWEQLPA